MKMGKYGLAAVAFGMLSMGLVGTSFGQAQPGQPGQGQGAQPGQPGGGNNPGGNNGRGNRGNFDPAQMRAQYLQRIKEQLGANDDEWKVLEPKLTKVMDASRAARSSGGFGGFSGRTRGGAPGGTGGTPAPDPTTMSPVAKASADLRAVVENKSAAASEYTEKLAAFRKARDAAKAESAAAQKDLKELLTPKQEAILVSSGVID
jgi:hypothetical protein